MPRISDRSRAMWRSCLGAALRTMLACTIVGCATLYGPASLRRQLSFPALSYVTVILIVTDATLGDTVRGCWFALYATVQGVLPAILILWAIGPARLSGSTAVLAVALSAFVVSLPESTHLIAKRIALGQIVVVYVIAFINGVHTEAVMHPVHVAASTAVGAIASVMALLFPYPRLACYEVKKKYKLFAENASGRLNLFVNAICAADNTSAVAYLSQAKSLSKTGAKLLQSVKLKQESMKWERPRVRFLQPHYYKNPGDMLQPIEIPLRGMEFALASCPSFPISVVDSELKTLLHGLKEHISLTLKQSSCSLPCNLSTVPEGSREVVDKSLHTLHAIFPTYNDLPSFFFLFCMKLLYEQSATTQLNEVSPENNPAIQTKEQGSTQKQGWYTTIGLLSGWPMRISSGRLMLALKCSLSLGLAVLFGLIFSKENGYWAGLTVAIGIGSGREATFKVANVKAQGTVLGSVYGVLGCFVFQRFVDIRFLTLLPWIIFTSFLRRSRMYDQAGGISAVIAALIILGRKNYGPPSDFAIARITETFIALSCSILVELLLHTRRAATLAKIQLSQSLGTLHECIGSIHLCACSHKNKTIECLAELREKQKKLRTHVSELAKFIAEAEVEPNFWFLPFHSACYGKLLRSLSKMVELLLFGDQAMGLLVHESHKFGKYLQVHIDGDLEILKNTVGSSMKCFEEITSIKSLSTLDKELQRKDISFDIELGKSPWENGFSFLTAEDEMEKIISSFLQHSRELIDKIHANEEGVELKSQLVLCLSALGFCMGGLMKETREIEMGVKELVQWENPSSHINLYEISCKIHALCT